MTDTQDPAAQDPTSQVPAATDTTIAAAGGPTTPPTDTAAGAVESAPADTDAAALADLEAEAQADADQFASDLAALTADDHELASLTLAQKSLEAQQGNAGPDVVRVRAVIAKLQQARQAAAQFKATAA